MVDQMDMACDQWERMCEQQREEEARCDAGRFRELERRIQTFEQPNGKYRHWLLLSIESESPDPGEAIDELVAKRKGGK